MGDDLLRKGVESARTQAEEKRRQAEAEAEDRAYMERRIPEFVQAVDECLRVMSEHGNPGLERFTLQRVEGAMTLIEPVTSSRKWKGKRGWRLGSPGTSRIALRVLTPSGEFASFHGIDWVTAAAFIRREIAGEERLRRDAWFEANKRRTVNFVGTPPPSIGGGEDWRAHVDDVIESSANDLGELLHRHGIDVP